LEPVRFRNASAVYGDGGKGARTAIQMTRHAMDKNLLPCVPSVVSPEVRRRLSNYMHLGCRGCEQDSVNYRRGGIRWPRRSR